MSLGDKIFKYRKIYGLSQEELSEKIDVTRQTISNWELNETTPNGAQLKLLSKYLNVSVDELLDTNMKYENKKINRNILLIIIIILITICTYVIIHNNFNRKKDINIDNIICKVYEEEHNLKIKYYKDSSKIIDFLGDTYFIDILDIKRNYNVNKVYNIINDYVRKNNGVCNRIYNKDLSSVVDMSIEEDSLTKTGMDIVIRDTCPSTIVYGKSFILQKYVNNKWVKLKPIYDNYGFDMMAYYKDESGKLMINQNWAYIYGVLDKGTYRLVKDVFFNSDVPITEEDKYYIYLEFEL